MHSKFSIIVSVFTFVKGLHYSKTLDERFHIALNPVTIILLQKVRVSKSNFLHFHAFFWSDLVKE